MYNSCWENLNLVEKTILTKKSQIEVPGEGVFDAKVDRVDEQVGDQKEEIGAAEAGQQMVENIPH